MIETTGQRCIICAAPERVDLKVRKRVVVHAKGCPDHLRAGHRTERDMSFWRPTTWGGLQPGDRVRAPDGSAWRVEGFVSRGSGLMAYLLCPESITFPTPADCAWSEHAPGDQVQVKPGDGIQGAQNG